VARRADPLRRDLKPTARPTSEFCDPHTPSKKMKTGIQVLQLDRRSRPIPCLLCGAVDRIFSLIPTHELTLLPAPATSGSIRRSMMALNARQQEAVDFADGPLLILAGAGSGKTRVLVHRITRLIAEGRLEASEILAVTFTNKAARELVGRLERQIGPAARAIWAGTFHGIGARILRRHAECLGYPTTFTILDADDQLRIVKDLLAEENVDEAAVPAEAVRAYIEAQKNEARLPGSAPRTFEPGAEIVATLYERYQARLLRIGAMDFGDLILGIIDLFRQKPELLAHYQQRFRHVLVDEYQDTNHAQYLMVSMLAAKHGNICVVGDDDQSIYGWRGASLRNIREFARDFPGAKVVHLDQNYRSTGNIIAAAGALIANNRMRSSKLLWTENPPGPPVMLYCAVDEREEAQYVTDRVRTLGDERRNAAVFYRTNAQSRAIEEALVYAGIPYVIVGATRFYDRREIKDLIAYLRFIVNPKDDASLARIMNVPHRGIGRVTWDRLAAAARSRAISVWEVIEAGPAIEGIIGAARRRVDAFSHTVRPWIEEPVGGDVTRLLEQVIADIGYLAYLQGFGDDGPGRVENVRELLTVTQNFDASFVEPADDDSGPSPGRLCRFLEQLALASDVDGYDETGGAVTLMTAHNSKGLEFDYVFMIGMEEGICPHSRSTVENPEEGIEEERRLCYVAMTRARRELTLIRTEQRRLYGSAQFNLPSRFLGELPSACVSTMVSTRGQPRETVSGVVGASPPTSTYRVGMRVMHPMFGLGTVRKCDESGTEEKLIVQFERGGIKKLVARFARLQIVSTAA
jgi:DNA helicase-2/ATP-dependent DNA helicase PcrA